MNQPKLAETQDDQLLHSINIQLNKKKFTILMDKISLVNGVVAGVLQLESLNGFANFSIVYITCILLYILWICQLKPSKYYASVWNDLLIENFMRHLLNFVMTWTFTFAIVD